MIVEAALIPLSWAYGAVVALRNAAFDAGILRQRHPGVPVVSVGNIAAGGTGKTPLVALFARELIRDGVTVGILSRGYGRRTTGFRWVQRPGSLPATADEAGDEPALLAGVLPDALVAVDEDRVRGAARMRADEDPGVILLDDGFQHRWIARDLDLVVVAAADLDGTARLLPAGRHREPLASLERAGGVVVTGVRSREECAAARDRLSRVTAAPVGCVRTELDALTRLDGTALSRDHISGKRVFAFSGIGRPGRFEATVAEAGGFLAGHTVYRDHHRYTERDMDGLIRAADRTGAEEFVTTHKDAVRLGPSLGTQLAAGRPLCVVRVRSAWTDEGGLMDAVRTILLPHDRR